MSSEQLAVNSSQYRRSFVSLFSGRSRIEYEFTFVLFVGCDILAVLGTSDSGS